MPGIDLITAALSFLFTVMIFSYLLGDNPLFRIGIHIFVGAASGYVAAVAMWQVLYPRLLLPLAYGTIMERALLGIPFLLAGLLLMKAWPRLSAIGTPSLAYLAGVSAAVTIGGGVIGTLFPQAFATMNAFDLSASPAPFEALVSGAFILVGAVTSLAYFHFGARALPDGTVRRFAVLEGAAWLGRIFIAITLGVLFAGVFLASLTAFIERIASWINLVSFF